MGSENSLWQTLRKRLQGSCHYTRHEDTAALGVPDVSYGLNGINGWIELKHLPDFPKRPTTPVRIRHFTDAQRHFLWERGTHGGYCWLLLQVEREYFLFDHKVVPQIGELPREQLTLCAMHHWRNWIDGAELLRTLQMRIR